MQPLISSDSHIFLRLCEQLQNKFEDAELETINQKLCINFII